MFGFKSNTTKEKELFIALLKMEFQDLGNEIDRLKKENKALKDENEELKLEIAKLKTLKQQERIIYRKR